LELLITAPKAAMAATAAAEEKSSDANTRTHHPCGISMAAIRFNHSTAAATLLAT
jgi:hypothetical protein